MNRNNIYKGFYHRTKTTFYKVLPDKQKQHFKGFYQINKKKTLYQELYQINKNNILWRALPEDKRGIEFVRDKEPDLVSGDGHGHQEVDLGRSRSPKFFDFRMRHGHVNQIKIFLEELEEEHEVFKSCLL